MTAVSWSSTARRSSATTPGVTLTGPRGPRLWRTLAVAPHLLGNPAHGIDMQPELQGPGLSARPGTTQCGIGATNGVIDGIKGTSVFDLADHPDVYLETTPVAPVQQVGCGTYSKLRTHSFQRRKE